MKNKVSACLLLMTLFFVGCAQQHQQADAVITLSAQAFKTAIQQQGVQILDVRTAGEFQGGHIAGALQANWNDQQEFDNRTQYLDKKNTVYVYCQAGGRSAAAQAYLTEKGFKVVNLEGGMSNWKMNGLPVEGNSNAIQMQVTDFEKVVAENKLVLVDIGANWCPPCRKMMPVIEKIKSQFAGKFYFLAVDGGNDLDVMKHVQFEQLPTFIVYKNGKEVWRATGIVSEATFIKQMQ